MRGSMEGWERTLYYIRVCRLIYFDEGGFFLKLSLISIELFSCIFARVMVLFYLFFPRSTTPSGSSR